MDTSKCEKCGGRTALISGGWYYEPDAEPYQSGTEESALSESGDEWLHGFICDNCKHVQGMFNDEPFTENLIDKISSENKKLIATLKDLEWRLQVLQNHKDITPKFSNYIKEYMLTPDFAKLMAEIRKEEENNEKS